MVRCGTSRRNLVLRAFVVSTFLATAHHAAGNEAPVADAGPPRYAATDPVHLDGSGSYDPDLSGSLGYTWRQVSGQSVVIAGANTVKPTVSGFVQTDEVQICTFELTVTDAAQATSVDTTSVIIVPDFGVSNLQLASGSFDPKKPTFVYFGGGDCVTGSGSWNDSAWNEKVNVINFPSYAPDPGAADLRTYYRYGDMLIVYLSSMAPDYREAIQTSGYSTGGQPAIDVGIRLNLTYADARYAVNRVTFLDALGYCREDYQASIEQFLGSAVDGEQCWIDSYACSLPGTYGVKMDHGFRSNVLNVWFDVSGGDSTHPLGRNLYRNSLANPDLQEFNHGLVGGAYWSVVGPGKNLQLAYTPGVETYKFTWYGNASSGYMDFYDETNHPGRLPEPVTLAAWLDPADTLQDVEGAVLTCHESENAVGYELLLGPEPHRVAQYEIISDTPTPPLDVIEGLPWEETWWTIRVRDQHGSTIYADPIRLDLASLPLPSVENARTGKRYGLIGHAILDAEPNDVILLGAGIYEENITFTGKSVAVRSLDPNDPVMVAGTIIGGLDDAPTVTFSGPESAGCMLAGLTIQGERVAVSCRDAAPMLQDCVLESPDGVAIEFWHGRDPTLIDCTVSGQTKEGGDPGLVAYWKLDEAEGMIAHDSEGDHDATVMGIPLWQPTGGVVDGALEFNGMTFVVADSAVDPGAGPFSVLVWVKGGAPGQGVISQQGGVNWLLIDVLQGRLMTELSVRPDATYLCSDTMIADGNWHRVGFTWDGSACLLYVDGVLVAEEIEDALTGSAGKLVIGCGKTMTPTSFFTGLIDDVRIYNRAVKPQ